MCMGVASPTPRNEAMETKYNRRSPAVRRLMKEAIELRNATPLYHSQPLEDNLFEWHFTIRGPPGTDYEGGRYHGRIILPSEYPMKPPSVVILTPNGRFELNQKICLSASSYHPELWQASWGIRTMMLALIGFMPSDGLGTIGSLECSAEERRRLAQRSVNWVCPTCGAANRSVLPDEEQEQKTNENESEEIADIVSQMVIKSEQEVDAQFKQQQQAQKQHPVSSNPAASMESLPVPAAPVSSALHTEVGVDVATTGQSSHLHAEKSTTASLLLIIFLVAVISALLARRLLL